MGRTDHWRDGDPVTLDFNGHIVTGTARVIYRRDDRQRFVKVHITSGPKTGTEVWASDVWLIGQGAREYNCLECGYRYRSNEERAGFCPPCDAGTGRPVDAGGGSGFGVRWKSEERGRGRRRW